MDLKKVKDFIQLAKSENVAELKIETKELKLSVSFVSSNTFVSPQMATAPVSQKSETVSTKPSKAKSYHEITSPFVGTFYSSPAPGKDNYVKVGTKISKGAPLCVLEAMKIMNEIESDVSGEIVEICVENESLVEFGQVLFRIKV